MARKLVFRIRKKYFDQIVAGSKTVEYRRDIPFWQVRLSNIFASTPKSTFFDSLYKFVLSIPEGEEVLSVFICGKRKHMRRTVKVCRIRTPDYFSNQGKKDVNTDWCLAFHLGEVVGGGAD